MSKQSRKKSSKTSRPASSAGKAGAKPIAKSTAESTAKSAAASGRRSGSKAPPKAAKAPSKAPAKTTAKTTVKRAAAAAKKPVIAAGRPAAKSAAKRASSAAKPASESAPNATVLAAGMKAPDFTLPRDGGGTIALSDHAGRKLVLFFYPKANTPGCTKEAIDFTRLATEFAESGTTVLGVSADSVKAQDNFRDKHGLRVPLGSDERHEMLAAYGAWGEKSLYGRKFLGIIRSTVLIDRDGRVAKIWRNVKVDGHADAVLAAAKEL